MKILGKQKYEWYTLIKFIAEERTLTTRDGQKYPMTITITRTTLVNIN